SPNEPNHLSFLPRRPPPSEHDTSWDVAMLEQTPQGAYVARRPPAEERPLARKLILGHYMDGAASHRHITEKIFSEHLEAVVGRYGPELQSLRVDQQQLRTEHDILRSEHNTLKTNYDGARQNATDMRRHILSLQTRLLSLTEQNLHFDDVTELYEATARSLQGYNDILLTALSPAETDSLKSSGITYIHRFLDPPASTPEDIQTLIKKAIGILGAENESLCRALVDVLESDEERHRLHHPRPDIDTAMERVAAHLDSQLHSTLRQYLKADPKRRPTRRERTQGGQMDLFLFSEPSDYTSVASRREDLAELKAELGDNEAYLDAIGGK
ncbi:hypothetical protein DFH06DRAFT_1177957, partial [Mycena polygramma]